MDKKAEKEETQADEGWAYKPDGQADAPAAQHTEGPDSPAPKHSPTGEGVEWTASEFIAHEKGFGWYALLAVATLVVVAIIYLITRDRFSVAIVLIMAIIFGVAGSHKPRVIEYRVDSTGLTAGNKFYPYSEYKSFSMPEDGPFASIALVPMKRIAFPVGAFLAPDSKEEVLGLLSSHLPLERGELTAFESLMRHLRF